MLEDAKAGKTLGLNNISGNKRVNSVSPFHSSTVSVLQLIKKQKIAANRDQLKTSLRTIILYSLLTKLKFSILQPPLSPKKAGPTPQSPSKPSFSPNYRLVRKHKILHFFLPSF